jgi:BlaI family transcriptional regulator, penicillinase repressor
MKLSEFEIDVMQILWSKQESTAPEVHAEIALTKDVTYSTVKTIIDRLEKKKAIARVKQVGRTIIYGPVLTKDKLQTPLLKSFINRVFGGDKRPLFNHLMNDETLSDKEVAYLEDLIKAHKGKK